MQYVKSDNAAGRLYFILKKASQSSDSITVEEVWREALDAKELQESHFHRRIIMMQELVEEVKDTVRSIDTLNQDMLLKKFKNIAVATSTKNITANWKQQKALLDEATLNSLEYCSEELSRYKTEDRIEDDTLVEFDRQINELINDLHGDEEISADIKILLLDQLTVILRSIQEYRIRGAKGLQGALAIFYGHFIMQHQLFENNKDKKTIKDTLSLVANITDTATKALSLGKIAYSGVKQFFLE